jgi:hypothetical protein
MSTVHKNAIRLNVVRPIVALALVAGLLAVPGGIRPAAAQDYWSMSCRQLWYERNSYYKARGYCFKTAPAIRAFGNEGCYVEVESQIRFTPQERRQIDQIRAAERDLGCN